MVSSSIKEITTILSLVEFLSRLSKGLPFMTIFISTCLDSDIVIFFMFAVAVEVVCCDFELLFSQALQKQTN